jgi:hypothetical protein
MLFFLDWFFTIFHAVVTLFNLVGWISKKTRNLHLVTVALTLFSWLVLGFFYGFGYCFLTDWHYQILHKRGFEDLPFSYITFLIQRLFGITASDETVVKYTVYIFTIIVLITFGLQINKWIKKNQN